MDHFKNLVGNKNPKEFASSAQALVTDHAKLAYDAANQAANVAKDTSKKAAAAAKAVAKAILNAIRNFFKHFFSKPERKHCIFLMRGL